MSLRAGMSEDQIPVGKRLSSTVYTGPGTHLISCKMGTRYFNVSPCIFQFNNR